MHTLVIIELEEGALTVTFGVRVGRTAHVTRCHRVALPDLGREAVTAALRPIAADLLQGTAGVHVILGERRTQHCVNVVPKMPIDDVNDFIVREALRLTSMPNTDEVLVASRLVRRLKGGRMVVGATAMPRNVWEPLREAFKACNIQVLGLHSMEACLAAGAQVAMQKHGLVKTEASQSERCAVVECSAGRARFVLCDGKSAVQVRRFMIGGAENNPDALATQLTLELPRTLEWLRESGHQVPSVLVLGNRIGIGEESFDLIRGDLAQIVCAEPVSVTGDVMPSLATTALLRELMEPLPLPSLLQARRLLMPPSPLRTALLPAVVVVGGLCSLLALQEYRATLVLRDQIAESLEEREGLRQQLVAADVVIKAPSESSAQGQRLALALGLRRPVSRLVAEVSNIATDDIQLDGLQFASNERVVITGVVRGKSRTDALSALANFASDLRGLPYLGADGPEDISEVPGQQTQFRFRLGMAWRNS